MCLQKQNGSNASLIPVRNDRTTYFRSCNTPSNTPKRGQQPDKSVVRDYSFILVRSFCHKVKW